MDVGLNLENSYAELPEVFYARASPTPVDKPGLVVFNEGLADALGMEVAGLSSDQLAALFAGNALPDGATPIAQAYAGHQFGHFTMLGDGRAHLIGEQITTDGRRVDIQLKGSGQTPYSRRGDGRAVLGPMLREYLVSEAMHALGIPTTRALAVAATGEAVQRETLLPGAVLTRVAASHLRVGTFEFASAQRDAALLNALLDYTIQRHDPDLQDAGNRALALLERVIARQADLIVQWMRVGFVHGVMNTDNMTLSGETIDLGPCAFMDAYDPATVFSSIDHAGRYAFGNQPAIAQWNLIKLAEALLPIIDDDLEQAVGKAQESLKAFALRYQDQWLAMMRGKLGLSGTEGGDEQLITDLLEWMRQNKADYTNTFFDLSSAGKPTGSIYASDAFTDWHDRWRGRLELDAEPIDAIVQRMRRMNPAVIPRNHQVEEALQAATAGDLGPFRKLHRALSDPYNNREALAAYQVAPGPDACAYQTFCGT